MAGMNGWVNEMDDEDLTDVLLGLSPMLGYDDLNGEPLEGSGRYDLLHALSGTPYQLARHRAYARWRAMIARCEDPTSPGYPWYGAKGVRVCQRWHDFNAYLEDVGAEPPAPGLTLDRIDPCGPYAPENIRWADWHTQRINRRPAEVPGRGTKKGDTEETRAS